MRAFAVVSAGVCVGLSTLATAGSVPSIPQLDGIIESRMARAHVPGLQAAIIKDGEVVWKGAYGVADTVTGRAVDHETAFQLASASKPVTGVAAMLARDAGGFALTDDVQDLVGFSVRNPRFPGQQITPFQLLTHTSSVKDNWNVLDQYYVNGDSPIPLGQYMEDLLDPAGQHYKNGRSYGRKAPGDNFTYSNVGAALAGYLVEATMQVPFDQWCDARIFSPLGMANTHWFLADTDVANAAFPHTYRQGQFNRRQHYGFPDYPDGQLRSTASDMGRFMAMFAGGGEYNGVRVLDADTAAEMANVYVPSDGQGLIWYAEDKFGDTYMGHNGGDIGVGSEMMYRVSDGAGFVVIMNGEGQPWAPVDDIERALMYAADRWL